MLRVPTFSARLDSAGESSAHGLLFFFFFILSPFMLSSRTRKKGADPFYSFCQATMTDLIHYKPNLYLRYAHSCRTNSPKLKACVDNLTGQRRPLLAGGACRGGTGRREGGRGDDGGGGRGGSRRPYRCTCATASRSRWLGVER